MGAFGSSPKVAPHPGDSFAAHDVVGVDHVIEARGRRHVPADYDLRIRR